MGANIGTTITGWILVLKIGKYGYTGCSAFVYLFSGKERWHFRDGTHGNRMVFFGLELLKMHMASLRGHLVATWFQAFRPIVISVYQVLHGGMYTHDLGAVFIGNLGDYDPCLPRGHIYETAAALVIGEMSAQQLPRY